MQMKLLSGGNLKLIKLRKAMNNKIITILKYSLMSVFLVGIFACDKMEDVHKEYIEEGEIEYAPRPLMLTVQSGFNRLKVSWVLTSTKMADACVIVSDGKELAKFNTETLTDATVEWMLTNLEERSYNLDVFTVTTEGDTSVVSSTVGTVYGSVYKESLSNVTLKHVEVVDDTLRFNAVGFYQGLAGYNMQYTNLKSQLVDTFLNVTTDKVKLDANLDEAIRIRTGYLPEVTAVDTIYTDFQAFTVVE